MCHVTFGYSGLCVMIVTRMMFFCLSLYWSQLGLLCFKLFVLFLSVYHVISLNLIFFFFLFGQSSSKQNGLKHACKVCVCLCVSLWGHQLTGSLPPTAEMVRFNLINSCCNSCHPDPACLWPTLPLSLVLSVSLSFHLCLMLFSLLSCISSLYPGLSLSVCACEHT